jgi:hypothetical protein
MKTAVTLIETVQTGMDSYKDLRTTKVFEDSVTLLEIKQWIKSKAKLKIEVEDVSLACVDISDVVS